MNSTRDQIDVESRKEPERLEREIDQQRDTITNIVSALENKLSPSELVDRMMRAGKGAGGAIEKGGLAGAVVLGTIGYGLGAMAKKGGSVTKDAVNVVRDNPIPALLATGGLVWLYAASQDKDNAPVREYGPSYGRSYATTRATGMPPVYANRGEEYGSSEGIRDKAAHLRDKMSDRASDLRDSASERAADLRDGISDRASDLREGASERAGQFKEGISERASHLRDDASHRLSSAKDRVSQTAHNAADTVRHQADRARQGFSHMMDENPLVIGAIALGIGAMLGAALPVTRKEDELMGETGDKLRSKAGEAGQVMREKGREVAESAREKGKEVIQEAREKGKEVAQEAREKGKETASELKEGSSSTGGQGPSATIVRTGAQSTPGLGATTNTPGSTSGSPRSSI